MVERPYRLGDNAPVRIDDEIADELIALTEKIKAKRGVSLGSATAMDEVDRYKAALKEADIYGAAQADPDFDEVVEREEPFEVPRMPWDVNEANALYSGRTTGPQVPPPPTSPFVAKEVSMGFQMTKERIQEEIEAKEKAHAEAMNAALYGAGYANAHLGLAAFLNPVTPLMLGMAMAYYVSPMAPEQFFPPQTWGSQPAVEARIWLQDNGLVGKDMQPTEKLGVWMTEILRTPLPTQRWEVERD